MQWKDGNVYVDHPREPWNGRGDIEILVNTGWLYLNGKARALPSWRRRRYQAEYHRAKHDFDMDAALSIVERTFSETVLDALTDCIVDAGIEPIIVFPYLPFDDEDAIGAQSIESGKPHNALPFAAAAYLRERLGGVEDRTIVLEARVGRTKLTRWLRFLCQPMFSGDVSTTRPYILVDDVVTTGGTLAALRSHILHNGGTIIAATVLAHSSGKSVLFRVADETLRLLQSYYGPELEPFWLETIGHDTRCLTEAEARILVEWGAERLEQGISPGAEALQRLRTRLNSAAATGG